MRDWSFITCDVGPPFSRGGGVVIFKILIGLGEDFQR